MKTFKNILTIMFLLLLVKGSYGQIVADPLDSQFEGGELQLLNSNANYNQWNIDNYAGRLRFHHGGNTFFDMHPSGHTVFPNSVRLNNALRISTESSLASEGSILEADWGNYILTNNSTTRTLRIGVSNDNYTRGEIEIENNNSPSSSIFFKTSNTNGGATVRMKITGNGNVGIGTTSPDAKLTVKGDIHAEQVKVDLDVPAPDYVFKEGYDLKSLQEIQDYIKEHGHLPNIPSAKEMEEDGIELGGMNMKLLEKIEELTLYTIHQEEKLTEKEMQVMILGEELKALKNRLSTIEKHILKK